MLAKLLRDARRDTRMTLTEVSRLSGVSPSTILEIEQGRTDPRLQTQLSPIVAALGINLVDFIYQLSTTQKGSQ